ncbi:MAG TPA: hypothetical protein DEV81_07050 [Cyanobacteria bacterium UBA11049]|nr:hypothetical protein [Cyanobacteria bacterium UBA11049]
MKITKITYRALKSKGNYENEAFEASADVEDWEDPIATAESLRQWVEQRLNLQETVENLEQKRADLENEIAEAKDKWERIDRFFKKLGITIAEIKSSDEIPF